MLNKEVGTSRYARREYRVDVILAVCSSNELSAPAVFDVSITPSSDSLPTQQRFRTKRAAAHAQSREHIEM
jgi:hypothetical protein